MTRSRSIRFRTFERSRVMLLAAALAPGLARADVEWHPDLDTARAAARISQRPVLAVFVADPDVDTAAFEAACLGSPEAEAVLATCFEPVRVRIDERPDLARAAGVTHVPSACVLSADDAPLARLDAPNSPAAFVTAAIIAAQRVAAEHDASPLVADAGRPAAVPASTEPSASVGTTARGSLARVTAKVRNLSAFAGSQPQTPGSRAAVPATSATTTEPTATAASAAWPAETAGASPSAVVQGSAIEPAGSTLAPPTNRPWLDAAAQPSAQPDPPSSQQPARHPVQQPALAATPAAPPSSAAAPAETALPEPPQASWQSRFVAALQKPFGWGSKAADPPTMPPALPSGPLAAATTPAARAAQEPAAEADAHGSMPLGLEGYCPVTLVDRGKWAEGRAQWGARHRGRTYLFAGADEQRTFLADPDRYAPALSGDDPVLALDRHSSTPGQRRYGVTYRSRMYLFASAETRQAFTADPDRYAARIALAERTPAAAGDTRTY